MILVINCQVFCQRNGKWVEYIGKNKTDYNCNVVNESVVEL